MILKRSMPLRYIINGLAATAVHYTVLVFNLEVLRFGSAGVANLLAAVVGISTSFLGSRYFVFPGAANSVASQVMRFSVLYIVLALMHGAVLHVWTDRLFLDYRIGFVIATMCQMVGSYFGNKILVFSR